MSWYHVLEWTANSGHRIHWDDLYSCEAVNIHACSRATQRGGDVPLHEDKSQYFP
jgi:hypothetical protein